jgi:hypothetical protein
MNRKMIAGASASLAIAAGLTLFPIGQAHASANLQLALNVNGVEDTPIFFIYFYQSADRLQWVNCSVGNCEHEGVSRSTIGLGNQRSQYD